MNIYFNNHISLFLKFYNSLLLKSENKNVLTLANELFSVLAKSTTENWLNIPPLRHFISECLENLATIVVSQGECSAKVIIVLIII